MVHQTPNPRKLAQSYSTLRNNHVERGQDRFPCGDMQAFHPVLQERTGWRDILSLLKDLWLNGESRHPCCHYANVVIARGGGGGGVRSPWPQIISGWREWERQRVRCESCTRAQTCDSWRCAQEMANSLTLVSHSPCEEWLERWFEIRWQMALGTRLGVGTFNANPKIFFQKPPNDNIYQYFNKITWTKAKGSMGGGSKDVSRNNLGKQLWRPELGTWQWAWRGQKRCEIGQSLSPGKWQS